MKTYIPYSLLAAFAACGLAYGQTAYTTPVGYSTQGLSQGFNVGGLTLQTPALAAGKFENVTATTVTDNDVTYAPVAGRTYVLEITSGAVAGGIFEASAASFSGGTITITTSPATDLVALGLTTNDTYKLRLAPTLEEVFGTAGLANGGVLASALNIANSDVVWVPSGVGTYEKYFLRSSGGYQRITGTTTFESAPNVPLVYADGFLVQKRTSAVASLTVSGEVKTSGTNSIIGQGFNLVGVVAPVGLTLRTAGFEDDLAKALNVANSDLVWVQQPDLSYAKYYFHSGQGWRDAVTNVNLPALTDPALGNAVYIQKRFAPAVTLDLLVPTSYSNL